MKTRKLGNSERKLGALGLGCMGMSDLYGPADEAMSIKTIHMALDAGMNILDTGDYYAMGDNEMLLAKALKGRREQAFIAVKFGALRAPNGAFTALDSRPLSVKNFVSYSLKRLGTDYIDLYQPGRIDPKVPIEDTVGAMKDLVDGGYIRHIGLSEAGVSTIRRAHGVHPLSWVQLEYSLISRGIENEILPVLRELDISLSAYGVLSRGLLSGNWKPSGSADYRTHLPRFSGENLSQNMKLVEALEDLAVSKGVTPAQIAIAWVLAKGEDILPLIGARSESRLREALEAVEIPLSANDLHEIEETVPASAVAGSRYPKEQMGVLDSERKQT